MEKRRSPTNSNGQSFWHKSRKKVWTFFLAALCLMLLLGFQLADDQDVVDLSRYSHILDSNNSAEDENCKIPILEPWDETIRKYIQNASPLECRQVQPPLTFLHNQTLFFNKTALDEAGYSIDSIQCQKRCFDRGADDNHNKYGEWETFKNGTQVNCEFLEVNCRRRLLSVYNQFHSQLIPTKHETSNENEKYSVTLFVLDSVSQSHWHRGLNRTLDMLTNTYNATIMTGFNKVADNSFPNAMAFLQGLRNSDEKLPANADNSGLSEWPLIWKDFKKQDYVTFYAEDYPDFNLFNYLSKGFDQKPVDHHFRPFWLEVYSNFIYRRSKYLCYNEKPMHLIQMSYYEQLMQAYHGKKPFFALNWLTELAHDWLSQVSAADEDIEQMLKRQEERLQDTFLFMFSDHGHRFDPIRQTMIGRLEERMPFFSIHVPQKLLNRFSELKDVLEWNSKQLSSFFDLYVTLRDILDLQQRNAWSELRLKTQPLERFQKFSAYGLSLLRPLPEKRTCEEAGIPEEYCICQNEKIISTDEPIVQRAANHLVMHTNQLLEPVQDKCALLKLKQVTGARISAPNQKVIGSKRSPRSNFFPMPEYSGSVSKGVYLNYALMVEVEPNGAILEATARHYFSDDSIQIVGDVNRLNRYGNQSICIKNVILRKYCYCL